jgi:hypothetical protein
MLWIDWQTKESIYKLFEIFSKYWDKVSLRPAAYSDRWTYKSLDNQKKLTLKYIQKLDKMTIYNNNIKWLSKKNFLKLIFCPSNYKNILW